MLYSERNTDYEIHVLKNIETGTIQIFVSKGEFGGLGHSFMASGEIIQDAMKSEINEFGDY